MKRFFSYLIMCAITMFAGCSHVNEYISIAKRTDVSNSYYNILNSWTREKTVYSQFETTIRIVATLKSGEFMDAYRAEYNKAYMTDAAYPPLERDTVTGQTTDGIEILLYVYMPNREANNLASPRSWWQLGLVNGAGETLIAREIVEIENITPFVEKLFPYVNKYYGKFYRVTFASPIRIKPLTEGEDAIKKIKLVCTGILGRAELEWEMSASQ